MKAISFSLFGTAPIYLHGAIRNAQLYPNFFPDWQTVFFVEQESVPPDVIAALVAYGADVRPYSRQEYPNGMFPRFLIADDPNVERFIVRDVDSRPSQREVNAVNAWIESRRYVHAMRDHPYHAVSMLGGLWGAIGGVFTDFESKIKAFPRSCKPYTREREYGADQEFLWKHVLPILKWNGLIHDSFRSTDCVRRDLTGVPFPDGRHEGPFVGEIYDSDEQPNAEHRKVRDDWIHSQKPA